MQNVQWLVFDLVLLEVHFVVKKQNPIQYLGNYLIS